MTQPYDQEHDVPVRSAINALEQALVGLENLEASYMELLAKFIHHTDDMTTALKRVEEVNPDTPQGQAAGKLADLCGHLYFDLQMIRTEINEKLV